MSGPFGSSQWMYSAGGYEIEQSLRFNDDESQYLSWTPTSAGNRKTWTWSGWLKRGAVITASSVNHTLFGDSTGAQGVYLRVNPNDPKIEFGSGDGSVVTNGLFRDHSAWYHIVAQYDSANSSIKLYINGEHITDASITNPSLNNDGLINNANTHYIGRQGGTSRYLDGYLSDIYFIDGQALDPTSFGETVDGYWRPIAYNGSYGSNGFHLEFDSNVNDTSGNSNDWTANNLASYDYMLSTPTNSFAVFNALAGGTRTLSEGNLKQYLTATSRGGPATFTVPQSGKWYWETMANDSNSNLGVGVSRDSQTFWTSFDAALNASYYANGEYKIESATQTSGFSAYSNGDILSVAVDADVSPPKIYFGYNGTWQNSADPAAGTGGFSLTSGETYLPMMAHSSGSSSSTATMNFGQDSTFAGATTAGGNTDANGIGDFKYAPPTGYLALCTSNLPTPTIVDGSQHFNTTLWAGNGVTGRAITGVGHQPDFLWIKGRNLAISHYLQDSVRGATNYLYSDGTNAEGSTDDTVDSFDSDGFTLGNDGGTNASGYNYVGWSWKAGGTAVSNTDGSITSQVSANTDMGFSVISYTGNGTAGATVGHGLVSAAPELFIVKRRNTTGGWVVYSSEIGNDYYMFLDTTQSQTFSNAPWNATSPTSSVITLGSAGQTNGSGDDFIGYCFANSDIIKVGSYTGNGSGDGTFVYTGFRPSLVIRKNASSGSTQWLMHDTTRATYNQAAAALFAESSAAEANDNGFDILSNGFKARSSASDSNTSGDTYIYLAFAETPFKYANAR